MANIYNGYPEGLTDENLREAIGEYSDEIFASSAKTSVVMQLSPLIQMGNAELQRRRSKRFMKLSLTVLVLCILLSVTAILLAISASSPISDVEGDRSAASVDRLIEELKSQSKEESRLQTADSKSRSDWETKQLTLLNQLVKEIEDLSRSEGSVSKSRLDWETKQIALIEGLVKQMQAQSRSQLTISESRLTAIQATERAIRQESERLNTRLELVNRNVEKLQRVQATPARAMIDDARVSGDQGYSADYDSKVVKERIEEFFRQKK